MPVFITFKQRYREYLDRLAGRSNVTLRPQTVEFLNTEFADILEELGYTA